LLLLVSPGCLDSLRCMSPGISNISNPPASLAAPGDAKAGETGSTCVEDHVLPPCSLLSDTDRAKPMRAATPITLPATIPPIAPPLKPAFEDSPDVADVTAPEEAPLYPLF
ncbi:hypothetical protein KCU65_g19, partial [Aureobasidium melanogenum]